jgi:hypothetical protein
MTSTKLPELKYNKRGLANAQKAYSYRRVFRCLISSFLAVVQSRILQVCDPFPAGVTTWQLAKFNSNLRKPHVETRSMTQRGTNSWKCMNLNLNK